MSCCKINFYFFLFFYFFVLNKIKTSLNSSLHEQHFSAPCTTFPPLVVRFFIDLGHCVAVIDVPIGNVAVVGALDYGNGNE